MQRSPTERSGEGKTSGSRSECIMGNELLKKKHSSFFLRKVFKQPPLEGTTWPVAPTYLEFETPVVNATNKESLFKGHGNINKIWLWSRCAGSRNRSDIISTCNDLNSFGLQHTRFQQKQWLRGWCLLSVWGYLHPYQVKIAGIIGLFILWRIYSTERATSCSQFHRCGRKQLQIKTKVSTNSHWFLFQIQSAGVKRKQSNNLQTVGKSRTEQHKAFLFLHIVSILCCGAEPRPLAHQKNREAPPMSYEYMEREGSWGGKQRETQRETVTPRS